MTIRRMVISPGVFALSKPGVSIDGSPESERLFDLGLGVLNGIYMSGQVLFSSFVASTAGNIYGFDFHGTSEFVVNFGKTFPVPPQFLVMVHDPYAPAAGAPATPQYSMMNWNSVNENSECRVVTEIYTDHIRFLDFQSNAGGKTILPPDVISYAIFQV